MKWQPYTRGNEKAMWLQSDFQMKEVPKSNMVEFQIDFILERLAGKT